MAASEPEKCDAEQSLQAVQPEAPPLGDLPMMLVQAGQPSITVGSVAVQLDGQSRAPDALLEGVPTKVSADLARDIARHLNESLRCVVQHCIEGQTARLQASMESLKALLEGVQEVVEGTSAVIMPSESDASKSSTPGKRTSSLSSSGSRHGVDRKSTV
eukprot:TRINITY_DN11119_c1_g1_i1.p1 TRINITY_DN11119_c1_g1~~TRINITY_DN11119_c1_g1_i1.p1  ORF type:complete len:170 (+),score=39.38 TRINITY_DN11119_c1_g1_i1:36-512(+)